MAGQVAGSRLNEKLSVLSFTVKLVDMASPSPLAVLVARGDDINRSSWLLPVFWVEASIAIIFVSLRFYTQYVRRSIWHEDWTMLVSLVRREWTNDSLITFFSSPY